MFKEYIFIIVVFAVGIILGYLVSSLNGWKAKRKYEKDKADLKEVLDAHAKEGLSVSYEEAINFIKGRRKVRGE